MAEPTSCCAEPGGYCARVDTLFNLPGVHVLDVGWLGRRRKLPPGLTLVVETDQVVTGCLGCGVIAESRGRRVRRLHDIPAFGSPVELVWRQRRYRCVEPACPVGGFSEDHNLAPSRAKLTVGRRGGRSVASSGTTPPSPRSPAGSGWTGTPSGRRSSRCWRSWPMTPGRLAGVATLGVD
jgi:transposase